MPLRFNYENSRPNHLQRHRCCSNAYRASALYSYGPQPRDGREHRQRRRLPNPRPSGADEMSDIGALLLGIFFVGGALLLIRAVKK